MSGLVMGLPLKGHTPIIQKDQYFHFLFVFVFVFVFVSESVLVIIVEERHHICLVLFMGDGGRVRQQ